MVTEGARASSNAVEVPIPQQAFPPTVLPEPAEPPRRVHPISVALFVLLSFVCTFVVTFCVCAIGAAVFTLVQPSPPSAWAAFEDAGYVPRTLADLNDRGVPQFLITPGTGQPIEYYMNLLGSGFACRPETWRQACEDCPWRKVHPWQCVFVDPGAAPVTIYENEAKQAVLVYASLNCTAVTLEKPHQFWSQTCVANRCDQFDATCEHRQPWVTNCTMQYFDDHAVSSCAIMLQ